MWTNLPIELIQFIILNFYQTVTKTKDSSSLKPIEDIIEKPSNMICHVAVPVAQQSHPYGDLCGNWHYVIKAYDIYLQMPMGVYKKTMPI